jgi:hypothetical protein
VSYSALTLREYERGSSLAAHDKGVEFVSVSLQLKARGALKVAHQRFDLASAHLHTRTPHVSAGPKP